MLWFLHILKWFSQEGRWRYWSRGMLNSLPRQTHQNNIYMWSNSHWKQTADWQKDSCTTKAVKKDRHRVGRKGGEVIRLRPASRGGRLHGLRDPSWGMRGSYWAQQSWVLSLIPVGLTGGLKKPTSLVKSTHTYYWELHGGSRLKLPEALTSYPWQFQCTPQPSLLLLS